MLGDSPGGPPSPSPAPARRERLEPGTVVDHFRVIRLLGAGGMGEVYLARDTKLGRKVALKLVRLNTLKQRGESRQIMAEARATAAFSHPNIVTIYHVGEHLGRPYLALEYLEGETLHQRARQEPLGAHEVQRVCLSIAQALEEAHRRKVLHRDLKPGNVLMGKDGRVRVLDFGLAQWMSEEPPPDMTPTEQYDIVDDDEPFEPMSTWSVVGSPPYMAPEQWMGATCTGAVDIWALGVIAYELIVGQRPFPSKRVSSLVTQVTSVEPAPALPNAAQLPEPLASLVEACLQKNPQDRPSARELVQSLSRVVQSGSADPSAELSPFRGLQPFGERHAGMFFGRDAELEAFLERLRVEPVLPVVGPTGAGKSSFVQAGVVPLLKARGPWTVLQLRPGPTPFASLAAALVRGSTPFGAPTTRPDNTRRPGSSDQTERIARSAPETAVLADGLAEELAASPSLLALRLQDLAASTGTRVLLFVDQLEELYALVHDVPLRRSFMEAICGAADDSGEPVRVVFTLRDDFLGRVAEGPIAREKLSRLMLLRQPGPDALRDILEKPVAAMGYAYDDESLVDRMIEEVQGETSGLPFLQFAARMLWDRRDRKRKQVLLSVYERLGGMAGMLAVHADTVLDGLTPEQIEVTRKMLLRLVTAEGTRRILQREAVVDGLGDDAEAIVDRLLEARLLTVRRAREDGDPNSRIELAHEMLIHGWATLERWIRASHDDLAFLSQVEQAAQLWDRRGRLDDEVWFGDALLEAQRRLKAEPALPSLVAAFLARGAARQHSRDRARRLRRVALMVGLSIVAIVATLVAWAFANKQREAEAARERAVEARTQSEIQRAEAQREGARAAFADGRLVEARAKLRGSLETQDSPLARALWARLQRSQLLWRKDVGSSVYDLEFSPDGGHVAAACQDGSVHLFDVETMAVQYLRGHTDQVFCLAHSPDGKTLASGTWGGDLALWNLENGAHRVVKAHESDLRGVAFSPDGKFIATGSWDGSSKIWNPDDGESLHRFGVPGVRVYGVAVSPDGKRIASADGDGKVRVWRISDGSHVAMEGHTRDVTSVDFSPAGDLVASSSGDNTVRLWRVADGEQMAVMRGPSRFRGVRFSPDGSLVASGSADMRARVWDAHTGASRNVFEGHTGEVYAVAFHPDGGSLASAGYDGTVRVWRLNNVPESPMHGHTALTFGVAFSPSGQRLASSSYDRTIRIWDVKTGAQLRTISVPRPVRGIAFAPDGATVAAAAADETIRVFDVETGAERMALKRHTSGALDVAFSPDGGTLATSSWDKTIRFWNPSTGEQTRVLRGHGDEVMSISFSSNGGLLASGSADGTVRLWDTLTGVERSVLRGHEGTVYGVSFHPTEDRLVSAGADGTVRIWDARTGRQLAKKEYKGRAYSAFFHPDGKRVGICGSDGGALVWNSETGEELILRGHRNEVNFLAFGDGGRLVATTSDDQTVRVWEADTGRPFWTAPVLLASPPSFWSHQGWKRLGPGPAPDYAGKAWAKVVSSEARVGSQSPDASVLCLVTHEGVLQGWDVAADHLLFREKVGEVARVVAVDSGCLVLTHIAGGRGNVIVVARDGKRRVLSKNATSFGVSGEEFIVATQSDVERLRLDGTKIASAHAVAGITAVGRVGPWIVAGNRDGNLDLIPLDTGGAKPSFDFEDTPASPVINVLEGPMGTVIASYANGFLGIWDVSNGTILDRALLHGAVRHLRLDGSNLLAVTELGDSMEMDLGAFREPYCDLLQEVWNAVHVVWEEGLPVLRRRPHEHRCLRAASSTR
jgi:WD40 repeat protein/serine/threonine protein kinase